MSAKHNIITLPSNPKVNIECHFFQTYHFVMLENKQLSEDDANELLDHIRECEPCQLLHYEVKGALSGQGRHRASRAELLIYLKCLMDPLQQLEEEPHDKFEQKHRRKLKKRLAKAERRIKSLENSTSPDGNIDLECPDFKVHHFCMLVMKELTLDEAREITNHLPECQPCQRVYEEVQQCLTGQACPSRTEQLSFLRNISSCLWSLEKEQPRKFYRQQRRKMKKRLATLEEQVKVLQAQLTLVLAEKGSNSHAS